MEYATPTIIAVNDLEKSCNQTWQHNYVVKYCTSVNIK